MHGVIEPPYLIFIGNAEDQLAAKTGQGIVDWCPERALGQLRLPDFRADLGIPDMSVEAAAEAGARTLVIGAVNPGGGFCRKAGPGSSARRSSGDWTSPVACTNRSRRSRRWPGPWPEPGGNCSTSGCLSVISGWAPVSGGRAGGF